MWILDIWWNNTPGTILFVQYLINSVYLQRLDETWILCCVNTTFHLPINLFILLPFLLMYYGWPLTRRPILCDNDNVTDPLISVTTYGRKKHFVKCNSFPCPVIRCPRLSTLDKATVNSTEEIYGSVVNITCDPGYTFKTGNTYTTRCNESAQWSGMPQKCKRRFFHEILWMHQSIFI